MSLEVMDGPASLGRASLGLAALGRGTRLEPSEPGATRRTAGRIEIQHAALTEWWRATRRGVEHGFDVVSRPAGEGPLILDLELRGELHAATDSERSVALVNEGGRVVARYAELSVVDATGAELPASMAPSSAGVRIVVDDEDARYPIVIDPLTYADEATLVASDAAASDQAATSAAMSGDGQRVVVGAPIDDNATGTDAGAARVYVRSGTSWTEEASLVWSGRGAFLYFGFSVAITTAGDRIVVSAPGISPAGSPGYAVVFVRSGSTWTEEANLVAADVSGGDAMGQGVAISGDGTRAVVGSAGDDVGLVGDGGSARVFVRSGSVWSHEATLAATDVVAGDGLGFSVAISSAGDYVLAGASRKTVSGFGTAGAGRVFARSGTSWTDQGGLYAPVPAAGDGLGTSAAISGDGSIAVLGAPLDDDRVMDGGTLQVFRRSGTTWSFSATLTASTTTSARLGGAVAITPDGSRIVAGAREDDTVVGNGGSARIFDASGGAFTETLRLTPADIAGGDGLGFSVGLSEDGTRVIAGARDDDTAAGSNVGTVRVFRVGSGTGDSCTLAASCLSGSCVDGVCCDTACGGGSTTDCQACTAGQTGLANGTCGVITAAASHVCRAQTDACDRAETCSGLGVSCPADALAPAGTPCRAAAAACDATEECSGAAAACPSDGPLPDGTSCADAVVCDGMENCVAGACVDGAPLSCDDGNACTADGCAEPGGCVATPIGGCCLSLSDCDDGDVCTADACSGPGGTCTNAPIGGCCTVDAECGDASACTADTCDSATSRCVHAPIAGCCRDAAACDDGDACTADACDAAMTCAITPIPGCCAFDGDCDDGDVCTTDACSSERCGSTAIPGCCTETADCADDGDACTVERCDLATNRCASAPLDCDDGAACTDDACVAGACTHTPACADAGDGGAADAGVVPVTPGCACRASHPPSRHTALPLALALAFALARLKRARRTEQPASSTRGRSDTL